MIVYFKNGDIASTDLPADALVSLYSQALESKGYGIIRILVRFAGQEKLIDILSLDIERSTCLPKGEDF